MTLATAAWGFDGKTYNGEDMRRLVQGLAGTMGVGTSPGVTSGFKVTAQGTPNNTVSVAPGTALVASTAAGTGGEYHVWNDAALTSPTFAPTSTNGRIDRLILRVTAGVPALEIVQGIASASPAVPAITGDNFLELAQITFGASTSNVITAMIAERRVFIGRWMQAWGLLAQATTLATPAVNTETTVLTLPAITVPANRLVKITGFAQGTSSTQPCYWTVYLKEGVSPPTGTYLNGGQNTCYTAGAPASVMAFHIATPSAGAHSYFMTAVTGSAGGGLQGNVNAPKTWLIAEDVGPATPTPD